MDPATRAHHAFARRNYDDACVAAEAWLEERPAHPPAIRLIALALFGKGRRGDAIASYRSTAVSENSPPLWAEEFAMMLAADGRWRQAVLVLRERVALLRPEGLQLLLAASVRAGDARLTCDALRSAGYTPAAMSNEVLVAYARLCVAAEVWEAAGAALQMCLDRSLDDIDVLTALARLHHKQGRDRQALALWTQIVTKRPDDGGLRLQYAVMLAECALLDESRAERRAAVALGLEPRQHDMALYLMLFDEHESATTVRLASEAVAPAGPGPTPERERAGPRRTAGRVLRIGFVSAEFVTPPARHFLDAWLATFDRRAHRLVFYATAARESGRVPSYLQESDTWRDVSAVTDDELADILVKDDLDVLVDLCGHFPDNRLAVLARRPAAQLAAFPNYAATTGCAGIDWFLTDQWMSPPGTEPEYTEALHRLPGGCLVYAPPLAPPIAPLPALTSRTITFGVLQRSLKLGPEAWDAVAAVLRAVPRSRLLLHNSDPALDVPESDLIARHRASLATRDVNPSRLQCVGRRALPAHLDLLGQVDIALDTYPFGGQTTTMECLWMGVPVITRTGPSHVSRVSGALMARVGLPDLAADSIDGVVRAADTLVRDIEQLSRLRLSLRDRMVERGLTDGRRLAHEMSAAFRTWIG